ncbi:serine/threonine-protein kinase [Gemmatimonadota bacterium]
MIGKTIDRYKIVDKLGEGGMGSVWKAEDSKLNRLVALKTLSPHLAEDVEARERFTREAQAASALNHPNITTIYDLLDADDQHFICMEYVEGKTLREMVESGRVGVKKAVDIILHAAEALEAAHRKGILHRDIKSANIMVSMEGNVKVMDFGLAHLEGRSQLTRTGTTMGTLAYSSPEQVTGAPVDNRSEIYSLGVVFYELLTGILPFTAASEAETLYAILNDEPQRISNLGLDLPKDVEAVVEQMLQKDPSRRYGSCEELIEDLQALIWKIETSDLPTTPVVRAVRARRRRNLLIRTLPILGGIILMAVVLGVLLNRRAPLDLNRIAIVVLETEADDSALNRIVDDAAMSLMRHIQSEGLVSNVFRGEAAVSALANRHTRGGIHSVLEALARDVNTGTVVTFTCHRIDEEQFRLRISVYDMVGGEDLPHVQIDGSTRTPEESIARAIDNALTYVAVHLDLLTGPMAHAISLPINYSAYRSFQAGMKLFNNGDWLASITPLFRAWEQDNRFFVPLFIAGCAFGNQDHFTDPRADSLLSLMQRQLPAMGPMDQIHVDWLVHSRDRDFGERYQTALEMARLAPKSESFGGASHAAAAINYMHEAVKYGLMNLRRRESDPRLSLRGFMHSWRNVGNFLHILGKHRKELRIVRRGMEFFPHEIIYLAGEARALAALDRQSAALSSVEEILRISTVSLEERMSHAARVAEVFNAHGAQSGTDDILLCIQRFHDTQPDSVKRKPAVAYQVGRIQYLLGHWDSAEQIFQGLMNDSLSEEDRLIFTGHSALIAARKGDTVEARRLSDQIGIITVMPEPWLNATWQARIASVMGDQERAIDLLTLAISQGFSDWMIFFTDPDLVLLDKHPDYRSLREPKG